MSCRRQGGGRGLETQKVIIPPGLADLDDVTLIEIPRRHMRQKVVVAMPYRTERSRKKMFNSFLEAPENENYTMNGSRFRSRMQSSLISGGHSQYSIQSPPPRNQSVYGGSMTPAVAPAPYQSSCGGSMQYAAPPPVPPVFQSPQMMSLPCGTPPVLQSPQMMSLPYGTPPVPQNPGVNMSFPSTSSPYAMNSSYVMVPVDQTPFRPNGSYVIPPVREIPNPYLSPYQQPIMHSGSGVHIDSSFRGYTPRSSIHRRSKAGQSLKPKVSFANSSNSPDYYMSLEQREQEEREEVQDNLGQYQMARRQFLQDAINLAGKIAAAAADDDDDLC